MDEQSLRQELSLLVGYLLTSAHGLYGEPKGYGPFRLMDAAGRVLAIMEAQGLRDPFLEGLESDIAAELFSHSDDDQLKSKLDEFCMDYARELKRRTSPDSPS
jgi:hypothetical protein